MGAGIKRAIKATKATRTKKVIKPTKKGTLVTFILDESGSMDSCKTDTIGGYNQYIKKLQADGKDILFSLTKFDSMHITRVLDGTNVKEVPALTDKTFTPGASTPLYDAIGKTIQGTNETKRNIVCIIMTDGEENSSTEHTKATVEKLIKEKTKQGWTFVYLGANQDAWAVGQGMGIAKGNVKNYDVTKTKGVFGALAGATNSYSLRGATCNFASTNYFEQDEKDSNIKI